MSAIFQYVPDPPGFISLSGGRNPVDICYPNPIYRTFYVDSGVNEAIRARAVAYMFGLFVELPPDAGQPCNETRNDSEVCNTGIMTGIFSWSLPAWTCCSRFGLKQYFDRQAGSFCLATNSK